MNRLQSAGAGAEGAGSFADAADVRTRRWLPGSFKRHHLGILGGVILLIVVLLAIFGGLISGYDPNAASVGNRLLSPFSHSADGFHILGTDSLGRDTLARLSAGGRASLSVAFFALILGGGGGVTLGVIAGYFGGIRDNVISRLIEAQLSVPNLILALMVAAALGLGFVNTACALAFATWPVYARIMRAETLRLRSSEYLEAALTSGASTFRVLRVHVMPNVFGALTVIASLELAYTILLESTLSYVGLGMQPPNASWGSMVKEGQAYVYTDWLIPTLPGLVILVTVLSLNLVGDWLRDLTDPRGK